MKRTLDRLVIGQVIAGADVLEMEYAPAEVDQVVVCEVGDPVLEAVCERRTKEGRKLHVEAKKLPPHLVRNAGVFYVCHRLSQMGWNALPKTRYTKGPNVVIDSEDEERRRRLKVRSLSKRDPVPLGKDPHIDADWVVVCIRVRTDSPRCYVLTPDEVSKLANRDKRGPNYWLEPPRYDTEEFAERWDRIGSGLA